VVGESGSYVNIVNPLLKEQLYSDNKRKETNEHKQIYELKTELTD
jgi:hypothetical protein